MKSYIIFDCYQTLIYKKDLEKIVQNFLLQNFNRKVAIDKIKNAYDLIYYRHKFNHPCFKNEKDRQTHYIKYNQELLAILGFAITDKQALLLNKKFNNSTYTYYPDTLPALRHFQKKEIPMGLLANWTATLEKVLTHLKLTKYFKYIDSSHNLKVAKPNPQIFKKILKEINQKYDKIYYIGDDYGLDVVPAREVGLTPILIDRQNSYPSKIDCPKIKDLRELKKIIK